MKNAIDGYAAKPTIISSGCHLTNEDTELRFCHESKRFRRFTASNSVNLVVAKADVTIFG